MNNEEDIDQWAVEMTQRMRDIMGEESDEEWIIEQCGNGFNARPKAVDDQIKAMADEEGKRLWTPPDSEERSTFLGIDLASGNISGVLSYEDAKSLDFSDLMAELDRERDEEVAEINRQIAVCMAAIEQATNVEQLEYLTSEIKTLTIKRGLVTGEITIVKQTEQDDGQYEILFKFVNPTDEQRRLFGITDELEDNG